MTTCRTVCECCGEDRGLVSVASGDDTATVTSFICSACEEKES